MCDYVSLFIFEHRAWNAHFLRESPIVTEIHPDDGERMRVGVLFKPVHKSYRTRSQNSFGFFRSGPIAFVSRRACTSRDGKEQRNMCRAFPTRERERFYLNAGRGSTGNANSHYSEYASTLWAIETHRQRLIDRDQYREFDTHLLICAVNWRFANCLE